jgi:hypothetical protein
MIEVGQVITALNIWFNEFVLGNNLQGIEKRTMTSYTPRLFGRAESTLTTHLIDVCIAHGFYNSVIVVHVIPCTG